MEVFKSLKKELFKFLPPTLMHFVLINLLYVRIIFKHKLFLMWLFMYCMNGLWFPNTPTFIYF